MFLVLESHASAHSASCAIFTDDAPSFVTICWIDWIFCESTLCHQTSTALSIHNSTVYKRITNEWVTTAAVTIVKKNNGWSKQSKVDS
jgi:hypothetical protein